MGEQGRFFDDLPTAEPDTGSVYTCVMCYGTRPAEPVVLTVDRRYCWANCLDCGKRRVFKVQSKKGTPSRDTNDNQEGTPVTG